MSPLHKDLWTARWGRFHYESNTELYTFLTRGAPHCLLATARAHCEHNFRSWLASQLHADWNILPVYSADIILGVSLCLSLSFSLCLSLLEAGEEYEEHHRSRVSVSKYSLSLDNSRQHVELTDCGLKY